MGSWKKWRHPWFIYATLVGKGLTVQCLVHATVSSSFSCRATAIATDTAFRQYINDIAGAADPNCLAPDSSHPGQFVFGIWDHYPIVYLDHYPSVYDATGRVGNSPHWDMTGANLTCGTILVTSGTAVKPVVVVWDCGPFRVCVQLVTLSLLCHVIRCSCKGLCCWV